MVRTGALASLACAALLACGGRLPDPTIESVSPRTIVQGEVPTLILKVDAVLPYHVDYAAGSAQVATVTTVEIGGRPADAVQVTPQGTITCVAPFGLEPGPQGVTLTLEDGRSSSLASALEVEPAVFPEGLAFDPVPDQRRAEPFQITVRAIGAGAAEFKGVVRLSASRGVIEPQVSGPFVNGLLVQTVTLSALAQDMVLVAEDAVGHRGTSNRFIVTN